MFSQSQNYSQVSSKKQGKQSNLCYICEERHIPSQSHSICCGKSVCETCIRKRQMPIVCPKCNTKHDPERLLQLCSLMRGGSNNIFARTVNSQESTNPRKMVESITIAGSSDAMHEESPTPPVSAPIFSPSFHNEKNQNENILLLPTNSNNEINKSFSLSQPQQPSQPQQSQQQTQSYPQLFSQQKPSIPNPFQNTSRSQQPIPFFNQNNPYNYHTQQHQENDSFFKNPLLPKQSGMYASTPATPPGQVFIQPEVYQNYSFHPSNAPAATETSGTPSFPFSRISQNGYYLSNQANSYFQQANQVPQYFQQPQPFFRPPQMADEDFFINNNPIQTQLLIQLNRLKSNGVPYPTLYSLSSFQNDPYQIQYSGTFPYYQQPLSNGQQTYHSSIPVGYPSTSSDTHNLKKKESGVFLFSRTQNLPVHNQSSQINPQTNQTIETTPVSDQEPINQLITSSQVLPQQNPSIRQIWSPQTPQKSLYDLYHQQPTSSQGENSNGFGRLPETMSQHSNLTSTSARNDISESLNLNQNIDFKLISDRHDLYMPDKQNRQKINQYSGIPSSDEQKINFDRIEEQQKIIFANISTIIRSSNESEISNPQGSRNEDAQEDQQNQQSQTSNNEYVQNSPENQDDEINNRFVQISLQ